MEGEADVRERLVHLGLHEGDGVPCRRSHGQTIEAERELVTTRRLAVDAGLHTLDERDDPVIGGEVGHCGHAATSLPGVDAADWSREGSAVV
jgi:hypothetical protein